MMNDQELPNQKRPAHLPIHEYGNRSSIIFLTICSKDRRPILATQKAHNLLIQSWKAADDYAVGKYVVLPDHIHLFCAPNSHNCRPLSVWVKYWKALVSKQWPEPTEKPIWQSSYWDRQLRNGESYSEKWSYVQRNPVRHKLVTQAEDWPYQGELCPFYWHD